MVRCRGGPPWEEEKEDKGKKKYVSTDFSKERVVLSYKNSSVTEEKKKCLL